VEPGGALLRLRRRRGALQLLHAWLYDRRHAAGRALRALPCSIRGRRGSRARSIVTEQLQLGRSVVDEMVEQVRRLAGAEPIVFTIPGEPYPKERARHMRTRRGKVRVLNSERQRLRTAELRWQLQTQWAQPWTGTVVVGTVFFRSTRRVVDLDNLEKMLWDSAKGVLFLNDRQVRRAVSLIEVDPGHPRTVVAVARGTS
jgi:Holliday junction resolvase RusA-like endonuclease